MMDGCKSFELLCDMMRACDFYDMRRPVRAIANKMAKLPLDNAALIDAYKTIYKLEDTRLFCVCVTIYITIFIPWYEIFRVIPITKQT